MKRVEFKKKEKKKKVEIKLKFIMHDVIRCKILVYFPKVRFYHKKAKKELNIKQM